MPNSFGRGALPGLACGVALAAASPVHAADDLTIDARLAAGAEYDSNVAVDEADINTRRGDEALTLSGSAQLAYTAAKGLKFELGYDFDQSLHQEETDFDLQVHGLSASASLTRGTTNVSLDTRYRHALLGGENYLDLFVVSPSVTTRLAKRLALRIAFTAIFKEFVHSSRLDGSTVVAQLDAYRYFANRKGYLSLGLRYDSEDVAAPELDYSGVQASARLQFPLAPLGSRARLRLGYTYAERDYDAETPSIGRKRSEQRSTFTAALDLPLTERLTLKPNMRYVDRSSNLPLFDYREHVFATALEYRF